MADRWEALAPRFVPPGSAALLRVPPDDIRRLRERAGEDGILPPARDPEVPTLRPAVESSGVAAVRVG